MGRHWIRLALLTFIGGFLGGPTGAVFLFLVGLMIPYLNTKARQSTFKRQIQAAQDQEDALFLASVFSMLAKLVRVDGNVSQAEIEVTELFIDQVLKLDKRRRAYAINIFRQAKNTGTTFSVHATEFHRMFYMHPHMLEIMLDVLFKVAIADGDINQQEERLIRAAADIFNFHEADYQAIRSRYILAQSEQRQQSNQHKTTTSNTTPLDRAYKLLEASPRTPLEEIKSNYRRLVSKFHPDKIASKELPEEFISFANAKFKEIQEAYELVIKERG